MVTLGPPTSKGFTFIEVLIAMAIFTIAVLAAIDITSGSVRATRDARDISSATWLLQQKMVELETKLETDGVEKACDKKNTGKFSEPFESYTWETNCDEVDFQISETASKLAKASGEEEDKSNPENVILKMILKTASDYITQSIREVHVVVNWTSGKAKRSVDATTHFVRYDQKVSIGGVTTGGTGTTPDDKAGAGGGSGQGGTTQ